MNQIANLRSLFHQTIRRDQINRQFQRQRTLTVEIQPTQAQKLLQCLSELHKFIESNSISAGIINCLSKLHNLIRNFMIIDIMMMDVKFQTNLSMVRMGQLPVQCSWIELVLLIFHKSQDICVQQQCSAILAECAYQLRISFALNNSPKTLEQLDYLKNGINLNYLSTYNPKLVINLLTVIQQLVLVYLTGKLICPNQFIVSLSAFLQSVYNDKYLIQNQKVRQVVITTTLLLVHASNMYKIRIEQLEELSLKLRTILLHQFKKLDGINTLKIMEMIRIMSIYGINIPQIQIEIIQSKFPQIQSNYVNKYVQMLNAILYANKNTLSISTTKFITNKIFSAQIQNHQSLMEKQWLLILLKRHLMNFGQDINFLTQQVIISSWGDKGCNLDILLQAIRSNQCIYTLAWQIIAIVVGHLPTNQLIRVSEELQSLHKYKQYEQLFESLEQDTQQNQL